MPYFYVNTREQTNGDHEVHEKDTCSYPPHESNRLDLGWHYDCSGAVTQAKKIYSQVNGCYYCCNACHTG